MNCLSISLSEQRCSGLGVWVRPALRCPFHHVIVHVSDPHPPEELQKVLLEQIDLRRRLEQEFHALKGSGPFPVFREWTPRPPPPQPRSIQERPHLARVGFKHGYNQPDLTVPCFFLDTDNFHDQMKRDLAYREEMVQQLQMVGCPDLEIIIMRAGALHLGPPLT